MLTPPYDDDAKQMTDQWLQQQPQANIDPLKIAAWLEGRLNARECARIEGLLAADPQLLDTVLMLRESNGEPVPASEMLAAQALVSSSPSKRIFSRRLLSTFTLPRDWQLLPIAFGAMLSAAAIVCSVWLGGIASLEFGAESMQTTSMLEITQLDFGGTESLAMAE